MTDVASKSALSVSLHPLVLLTISDHFTRASLTGARRIVGAILGTQKGREVEVYNCFELIAAITDQNITSIDIDFLKKKLDQFKKVYDNYDFLGWYTTGSSPLPSDVEIHKQLLSVNENPLLLMLDTAAAAATTTKDLPLFLYESEVHLVDKQPKMVFAPAQYRISTAEAERIGVDHVAHVSKSGTSGSQLTPHLRGMGGAIKMLNLRVKALLRYIDATIAGSVPVDHDVLRQISSLCHMLPTMDSLQFSTEFMEECNDAMLVTYLAVMTKVAHSMSEVVEKLPVVLPGSQMRGGRPSFF
ncbi:Mov34/MPN/PAD-1 family protein [Pelomyxa schiedti]|nr:Mov34/MPN/PAD-1 family protein [Pelomyxa schiedti]